MAALPDSPIQAMDTLAHTVELLHPEVTKVLGDLATQAASADSQAWLDKLNDSAERVYAALDALFVNINEVPTWVEEPAAQKADDVVEPPQPEAGLSDDQLDILRFLADHPYSRLEEIRRGVPSAHELTGAGFAKIRKEIQADLAKQNIDVDFDVEGKTRGTKYAILVGEGDEALQAQLAPIACEEPVALVENEVVVIIRPPTPPEAAPTAVLVPEPTKPESINSERQLLSEDDLLEYIAQQKQTGIRAIVWDLCKQDALQPDDFHRLNLQIRDLITAGRLERTPQGGLQLPGTAEPAALNAKQRKAARNNAKNGTPETSDADLDEMIRRTGGLRTPHGAFKPKQRGRNRDKRR